MVLRDRVPKDRHRSSRRDSKVLSYTSTCHTTRSSYKFSLRIRSTRAHAVDAYNLQSISALRPKGLGDETKAHVQSWHRNKCQEVNCTSERPSCNVELHYGCREGSPEAALKSSAVAKCKSRAAFSYNYCSDQPLHACTS